MNTDSKSPWFKSPVMQTEYETVTAMIKLFCRKHHSATLCLECLDLLNYTTERLLKCPFYKNKEPCSQCSVHCFKEPFKKSIKEVMRYSGPRMIIYHPVKAFKHLLSKHRP